jgi:hypothetical protein
MMTISWPGSRIENIFSALPENIISSVGNVDSTKVCHIDLGIIKSRGSAVDIATGYSLDDRGVKVLVL